MRVVVRPLFYQDIAEEVYWLLENAGPEVAHRWHDALWQTIEVLRVSPFIGRERGDLKQPGVRSWRVDHFTRWLILYGLGKDALVLYRVRSGTMDLAALKLFS